MVSKASEDLPEPDRPVNTTSWSRGMATSTFLRLCSRAPRMVIWRASRADLADRSAIRLSGTCESKVMHTAPQKWWAARACSKEHRKNEALPPEQKPWAVGCDGVLHSRLGHTQNPKSAPGV